MLNWLSYVCKDAAQLGVGLYRMGNLVYVKNWFLISCYRLVVRMGGSLVLEWKGHIGRIILVGDCLDLKYWYIGNSKSYCNCQTMRMFEPRQAWCYLF